MSDRKGRKYRVIPAEQWETFVASLEHDVQPSLGDAQAFASQLATQAQEENPKGTYRFAVVEEAGILEAAVETKVKQNFETSRTIVRRSAEEIEAEKAKKDAARQEAEASGRPRRGRKPGQPAGNSKGNKR